MRIAYSNHNVLIFKYVRFLEATTNRECGLQVTEKLGRFFDIGSESAARSRGIALLLR